MKKLFAITIIMFLAACDGPDTDQLAENNTFACEFLLEETRTVSAEILNLRHPLEVRYFGPCTCGVLYWHIVSTDESTVKICLEDGFRSMMFELGKQRFGIGNCHGQLDDIMFPVGSAEESAIIGAFSLWLYDEFSLEELVAAGTQPNVCLTRDYLDPAATAAALIQIFDRDPERFHLAHEILACDE